MWVYHGARNHVGFSCPTTSYLPQQNIKDVNMRVPNGYEGGGETEASELTCQKSRTLLKLVYMFVSLRFQGASTFRRSLRELKVIKMTFVSGLFSTGSDSFFQDKIFKVVKQHCLVWRITFYIQFTTTESCVKF